MVAKVISVVLGVSAVASAQLTDLDFCISSVGLPSAAAAVVSLTVSPDRSSGKITFDRQGVENASYLVFSVLRSLRFRNSCVGRRLRFAVVWEPSKDRGYGVSLRRGALVLTGYLVQQKRPPTRIGGPLVIEPEDLERLAQADSIRDFLRSKGADPDY